MSIEECLYVYFLDVGQGDCSLVVTPKGHCVLVDCRDAYVAHRFLKDAGITELNAVVVSHLDDDHINGLEEFIQCFLGDNGKIGRIHIPLDRKQLGKKASNLADLVIRLAKRNEFKLERAERDSILQGSDWRIDILSPEYLEHFEYYAKSLHAPNRLSAIVRVQYGGQSILIAGDAPLGAWEKLERSELRAKVMRAPHHGGDISEGAKTYSVAGFYQEVAPELSVFSVGTNNGYGHPLKSHMLAAGVSGRCRRLCTQLTPQCHASPASKYDEARMNASRVGYDYRHHRTRKKAEIPCAGTVIVSMNHAGDVQVRPAASDWHDRFVRGLDNPLCISV